MPSPIRIARELRQKMTPEEYLLWQVLRNSGIKGKKVRRQHPIVYKLKGWKKYFYVADFYCASRKLVIELDGKHHEFGDQTEYDKARDYVLTEMGMKILRIKNEEIADDLEGVLERLKVRCEYHLCPTLSALRRRRLSPQLNFADNNITVYYKMASSGLFRL